MRSCNAVFAVVTGRATFIGSHLAAAPPRPGCAVRAADRLLTGADAPNPLGVGVYNVGTGRQAGLLEMVAALSGILGTRLEPSSGPPAPATFAIPSPTRSVSGPHSAMSRSSNSKRDGA